MIGLTMCSGIGAPELAAPWVDWRFASEIEPFPRAVLQERFGYRLPEDHNQGEPILWGDMTEVSPGLLRERGIPLPDLVVAGTPCQAFSVAGLRKGTSDARGNLTLKFVEIVHELAAARPDGKLAVLWENVPGVLSDKGNAFGCFLGGLVGAVDALLPSERPKPGKSTDFWKWHKGGEIEILDEDGEPTGETELAEPHHRPKWPGEGMVQGPRARAAWSVLDAQWFGVAQRRRRVFVVVDFGNCIDPAAVLLEPDSLRGDSPPSREAGQNPAPTLAARTKGGGGLGTDFECDGGLIHETCATLDANYGRLQGASHNDANHGHSHLIPRTFGTGGHFAGAVEQPISDPLRSNGGDTGPGSETLVTHALRGEGFDASEDGTGRGTPIVPVAGALCRDSFAGGASGRPEGTAAGHFVPVAFDCKGTEVQSDVSGVMPPLRSMGHNDSHQNAGGHAAIAIQERAISENPDAGPNGAGFRTDDAAFTLEARTVPQAVAFAENSRSELRLCGGDGQVSSQLTTGGGKPGQGHACIATPWAVRRLTPRECERLQGMPDDHTLIRHGKARRKLEADELAYLSAAYPDLAEEEAARLAADGPRYKAIGNSMAVPVMSWILDRIKTEFVQRPPLYSAR